jgi:hypothetical protein
MKCKTISRVSFFIACAALPAAGACGETGVTTDSMYEGIEAMAWNGDYQNGQWEPDWDDAAFYGPAFYARTGWEENREDYKQRAAEGVQRNLALARSCLDGSTDIFAANMTELLYGTLGIMDYMVASGDESGLPTVDETIDLADQLASMLSGNYFEGFSNYAMDTYGPTVVTAMLAVVNLQYAVILDTPRKQERIESARAILSKIDEKAWNGSYYLFSPDRPDYLDLYPNIVMMITLARMFQATHEESFLERAESLYGAIEPLRCPDRPGYKSLYSAEAMGARTDDYTTLSATNYAIFAVALLAQITGKAVYRNEIETQLDFIRNYLYVPADGKAYHHWMDGRLALPTDPEYYCIGCNLQLIYIIWWVRHYLDW